MCIGRDTKIVTSPTTVSVRMHGLWRWFSLLYMCSRECFAVVWLRNIGSPLRCGSSNS